MYNSGYSRGNAQGPETLQPSEIIENTLFVRHQLSPSEVQRYNLGDDAPKIKNKIAPYGSVFTDTGEIEINRFVHSANLSAILEMVSNYEIKMALKSYIDGVNDFIRKRDQDLSNAAKEAVQADRSHQLTLGEDLEKVKKYHADKRSEKNLILAQKNKPARTFFTPEQEFKGIHLQTLAEDDLNRSRANLEAKESEIGARIKETEKEIQTLDAGIAPFQEKIAELEEKLNSDNLGETDFKNITMSIEFNKDKIQKIVDKILPMTIQNTELHNEVQKTDNEMKLIDLLIAQKALMKDVKYNYPRRRERLLFRIQDHLRDVEKIEESRIDLNKNWKNLTGDNQDLVPCLGLKADSTMYFL